MMTRHEFLWSLFGLGVGAATLGSGAACGTDPGTGDPGGPDDPLPDANTTTPVDAGNNTTVDASPGVPPADAAPMPTTCSTMNVQIGSNHGHSMTVATADLASTTPKMYSIQGSSLHPHTVTITPAQFAMLATNGTLTVTSSTNSGHPHTILVTCA